MARRNNKCMGSDGNKSNKIHSKTTRGSSNKNNIKARKPFQIPYAKLVIGISSMVLLVGIIVMASGSNSSKHKNIGKSPTIPKPKPGDPIEETPVDGTSGGDKGQIDPLTGRKWWIYPNPQGPTYKITHMHLVLAWLPGVCKHTRCWEALNMKKFYVHGLWPVNNIGRHKLRCNISYNPLDEEEPFQTLGPQMIQRLHSQWPSYERHLETSQEKGSRSLWKTQYEKHGACAEDIGLSVKDYFELVLQLTELNIENSLDSANMLHGPAQSRYTQEQFRTALEPNFGSTDLIVSCQGSTDELTQILLCIDAVTKTLGKCPKYERHFKCKSTPDSTVSFLRI